MRRWGCWLCALLATLVAGWLPYRYGISPLSLILALLLLSCPLIVVWLSLSQARKTERDIALATRQELARRTQSEPGSKPCGAAQVPPAAVRCVTPAPYTAESSNLLVENLIWASAYNVAAIPIAAVGLLHPMIGVIAMTASSLSVIANSLLLKRVPLSAIRKTH
ncbi:hypothetical protein [Pseudomonas tumuqii]|uniref:hypothetical protein n=1 Tax=Pseudomonas tumuqii TaxID=2715755 RepID=UPI0015B7436E|nr:hypothetical protein [Pseudomonas tumuqii]